MSESFYCFSNGELKRKDNVIRITAQDGAFKDIKVNATRDIYLFGEVSLNSKLLNYSAQMNIPLHFFNYYGFYTGSFFPKESKVSGKLLVAQVSHYTNSAKRLMLAQKVIHAAAHTIIRNIRYYDSRGKELGEEFNHIKSLVRSVDRTKNIEELMGIEGMIHKEYYSCWNKIIDQKIEFEKRVKNPPDNMINTLISFTNTLIYTATLSEIYKTQLNPTISYLHSVGERRFSLSLDIAEIFKPLVGDRMIFSLLNKNMITEKDFDKNSNFCYLKEGGRRKILQEFDSTMSRTIKHKGLGRNVSYRYLIRLECYKLIKHLLEDKEYEGFKIWW